MRNFTIVLAALLVPQLAIANSHGTLQQTTNPIAILALVVFFLAYTLVIMEEKIHLRKSKPVILASGIIWTLVAVLAANAGLPEVVTGAIKENILEYAELFLFLLVAMTYVNALEERQVFTALRNYLVSQGLSYRQMFWLTGLLSFLISPVADNLTTALLMCAVVMAIGKESKGFISLSCINIVVAANAGGAFSPFGDITTLMVWQKGVVAFEEFFRIFIPSLVNWLVPASLMSLKIATDKPKQMDTKIQMFFGAKRIIGLFLLSIITAVSMNNFYNIPPAIGMMTGLAYLQLFAYYLKITHKKRQHNSFGKKPASKEPFDIFSKIAAAEWDTLLFFYGVILCVGGLATLGYLELLSSSMYENMSFGLSAAHKQTPANIIIGIISAIIDNIPVMFAVLTINPLMSKGQWLLVTLTAGTGGSLLSIGSAAGVALMGQAKGYYTFMSHLKWIWAIFLGYVFSILAHIWLNNHLFVA